RQASNWRQVRDHDYGSSLSRRDRWNSGCRPVRDPVVTGLSGSRDRVEQEDMSWDWNDDALNAVTVFLRDRRLLRARPVPRRIGDGHSNLTYLMSDGERGVVLRRPPPPPLPKGANDV